MKEQPLIGSASALTQRIKKTARAVGFDRVGITRLENLAGGERAILDWVRQGRNGAMKYLADFRERRRSFFDKFGDAKSIIVLGVNYYQPSQKNPRPRSRPPLAGHIARYARGLDYHEAIARRHKILIERLSVFAGKDFHAESCVDSRPLPERYAAFQAGLGFVGKSTALLSPSFGPWLFLSEIVTNLELVPDSPDKGTCGSCSRCQKACPTGALDRDYQMDARLCIAYLTIEHKGTVPPGLREKIGDRLFGCDECLSVCPYANRSKPASWKEWGPSQGCGEWLDLKKLFGISSNAQYEKMFSGTALLRIDRKKMLRNACVVLANSGKRAALPYLKKALSDPSPLVREQAREVRLKTQDPGLKTQDL
ncbi:MAG: tRNA epoxyqueuosine(34) reductase QueG [Candidatus Omnitrophica bacterium]|nr:tRNA epoxyqueuosine(34) reductase QueG [Candidatus Omnitrophota bacterium]MDD5672158.1 tRNA epoxyqueuosine(34) reductase QueG [Candidatus Omnitrophota bacterium]